MNIIDERIKATEVRAFLSDFDGSVEDWKLKFYELWRWQMTFSFAYKIKVHDVSDGDVCVDMIVKNERLETVLDLMDGYGYQNIRRAEVDVGLIWELEHEELFEVDEVFITD